MMIITIMIMDLQSVVKLLDPFGKNRVIFDRGGWGRLGPISCVLRGNFATDCLISTHLNMMHNTLKDVKIYTKVIFTLFLKAVKFLI